MKRQRGSLRQLANSAKQRLSGDFWKQTHMEQVREVLDPTPPCELEDLVKSLLNDGVESPLAAILCKEKLETLSETERERYVLETSRRVQEIILKIA